MVSTRVYRWTLVLMAGALAALAGPALEQARAKPKTLTVCKHGCRYATIQSAVDHSGRGATIDVKPGKYVEGVVVSGHGHDGLRIIGLGEKPRPSCWRAATPTAREAPPRTGSRATTSTTSCWRT